MMGGSLFGGPIAFYHDPDEEQQSLPPSPTPVTFPPWEGSKTSTWDDGNQAPDLCGYFSRVHKPTDIRQIHLDSLNVTTEAPCSIHELVPDAQDGAQYIPPCMPEDSSNSSHGSRSAQGTSRLELYARIVRELRVENSLAFQAVTQSLPPGVPNPGLGYMRKFFEQLEKMSAFWDASLDNYYEVDEPNQVSGPSPKRQKTEPGQADDSCMDSAAEASPNTNDEPNSNSSEDLSENTSQFEKPHQSKSPMGYSMTPYDPFSMIPGSNATTQPTSPDPAYSPPQDRRRYKGRRLDTGSQMTEKFRSETAKMFLQAIVQPFRVVQKPASFPPHVHIGNIKLPARQTSAIYCPPKTRTGNCEGPILALQSRPEICFEDAEGVLDEDKCRLDRLREIGALLHLAQARRREGKTVVKPGEGQWWTTKPRWGGGPGGEVTQVRKDNESLLDEIEKMVGRQERKVQERKLEKMNIDSKARPGAKQWEKVRCGNGTWDPATTYRAVGKDAESEVDQVFLFSCLNHHMSILKMTVHNAYTDFLLQRQPPEVHPGTPNWCSPRVQRTQWFDLFDIEQRELLFRGLWGVMEYQLRNEELR